MEEKPQKKRKLTKKESAFVAHYAQTENGVQSVFKSYNTKSYNSAGAIAVENLSKPRIQEALEEKRKTLKQAMIDAGITEDYLADRVNVLLKAKDKEGNEDFTAINNGIKHAAVFHGVEDPNDRPKTQNTYNIIFSTQAKEKIRAIEAEIKDILIKPPNKNAQEN